MSKILVVIPARGGSKGIPQKNIKLLGDKPLIQYSIDVAREIVNDDMICVSTDDERIKEVCESLNLTIPFVRPTELSTDIAGTYEVLVHSLRYYLEKKIEVDKIVLLQPTSPFRNSKQLKDALSLWKEDSELIVGVKKTKANPYYVLMEENAEGYLELSKKAGDISQRQSVPSVYEINGAIYIINAKKLLNEKSLRAFKTQKYVMDDVSSVDIDEPLDWLYAETILKSGLLNL
jgi:CMP-N,N'-diacetyllegionaminic acid synthase